MWSYAAATEGWERRPAAVQDRERGTEEEPRRKRQLIVVAEDEPREWEIYGKILWYNGFDVLHASDGEEALALVRQHPPDLVILDLMMPKLNGIEVCQRLKQDPATSHIPVIALTARPRWEAGREARNAGCTAYLEKPLGPLAVLHAVEDLIGRAPPVAPDDAGPDDADAGPPKPRADEWN
ncbi:MAG TPA: response regulator [Longimicrobiales bacterium]|nr:response regulator [Longimicrobiales bacterium]